MASRKDYETTARVIHTEVDVWERGTVLADLPLDALHHVAEHFADLYQADNARFDRARFLDACGFGEVLVGVIP